MAVSFENKNRKIHFINPTVTDAPIYVHDLGHHQTPPSHVYGPAVRPYYLIHLVYSGKGTIERNGIVTQLGAGDAFVIRPQEVTTYKSDDTDPWEYCWIAFDGAYAPTIFAETTSNLCPKYRKSGYVALKSAIDNDVSDVIGLLNTLFAVLDSIKTEKQQTSSDIVSIAIDYIENNYFRSFDMTFLASVLGVSRPHFTTLFTKRTGESPYNYLTKIRIAKAKEYLASTSLAIKEIAYSVGFASLERFSEMFKNYTGLSPIAYRKEQTKN